MSDRIEKQIEVAAPVARVWKALTDHEQFGEWFRAKIESPFVVGQPSRGRITHCGYEHVLWDATVVEMVQPERFSFTWHPYAIEKDVDYSAESPTLVAFVLEPTPAGGTLLKVTESGFDRLPAHRRDLAFRMNDGGWAGQLKNIARYVESKP